MPQQRRGGSATLERVTATDGGPPVNPPPEQTPAPKPPVELPEIPTVKHRGGDVLEHKTITIYGEAGIGKSTLASEFGEVLFLDCAGELDGIEGYKMPVTSWRDFRAAGASIRNAHAAGKFDKDTVCIDTVDKLALYCSEQVRKDLGIAHESDADWGKGWSGVGDAFATNLAKLLAIPNIGVILVSHAKDTKIQTRNQEYTKWTPTLKGQIREEVLNVSDLVLFIQWSDTGDERVIYTKPGKFHEAKERGKTPRLPASIPWPMGTSGYAVLKAAWEEGGK